MIKRTADASDAVSFSNYCCCCSQTMFLALLSHCVLRGGTFRADLVCYVSLDLFFGAFSDSNLYQSILLAIAINFLRCVELLHACFDAVCLRGSTLRLGKNAVRERVQTFFCLFKLVLSHLSNGVFRRVILDRLIKVMGGCHRYLDREVVQRRNICLSACVFAQRS